MFQLLVVILACGSLFNKFCVFCKGVIVSIWVVYDVHTQGIDFVGYVFKPSQTRLRTNIVQNFKFACKTIRQSMPMLHWDHALSVLMAYKGWVKRCNGRELWRSQIASLNDWFPKQLRGTV